jgi:serine/threonine protein kinase
MSGNLFDFELLKMDRTVLGNVSNTCDSQHMQNRNKPKTYYGCSENEQEGTKTDESQQISSDSEDPEMDRAISAFTSAMSELKIHGLHDYSDGSIPLVEGRLLASGSTAIVRDGQMGDTGKNVAIKIFSYSMDEPSKAEDSNDDESIINKLVDFVDEARLGFKASKPLNKNLNTNVAATLGVSGQILRESREVRLILVMEKAKGQNLADLMQDESYWSRCSASPETNISAQDRYKAVMDDNSIWAYDMPPALKLDLSILLTQAVLQVHRSGVCHCDIKPENVVVEMDAGAAPILKVPFIFLPCHLF